MRILLTGATGFVGSHVVAALPDTHELTLLTRPTSSSWRLREMADRLRMVHLDQAVDRLQAGAFDVVVHMATQYARSGELAALAATNLQLPLTLLDAARRGNVRAFLNTSTFQPRGYTPYGLSKAHLSEWCRFLADEDGMRIIDLELQHPIGSMDSPGKFAVDLTRKLIRNAPCDLTAGEQRRDFVDVRDVATAFRTVIESITDETGYQRIEVGRGVAVTLREFVETVKEVAASTSALRFGALPYRDDEIMSSAADTQALGSLGWRWVHDLRAMATELVAYERSAISH